MTKILLECCSWRNQMIDLLCDLWREDSLCDVQLLGGDGKTVAAHSLILGASSAQLKDALTNSTHRPITIQTSDYSSNQLNHVLSFIYTGKLLVDNSELEGVEETARGLGIEVLETLCQSLVDVKGDPDQASQLIDLGQKAVSAAIGKNIPGSHVLSDSPLRKSTRKRKVKKISSGDDIETELRNYIKKEKLEDDSIVEKDQHIDEQVACSAAIDIETGLDEEVAESPDAGSEDPDDFEESQDVDENDLLQQHVTEVLGELSKEANSQASSNNSKEDNSSQASSNNCKEENSSEASSNNSTERAMADDEFAEFFRETNTQTKTPKRKEDCICPLCERTFETAKDWRAHSKDHAGDRPFTCDRCDAVLPTILKLCKHRKLKHIPCPKCGIIFNTKRKLDRHMFECTEVDQSNIYKCDVHMCDRKFITKKGLSLHHAQQHEQFSSPRMKVKAGDDTGKTWVMPDVSCSLCKMKFPKVAQRDKHEKHAHHLDDQTVYPVVSEGQVVEQEVQNLFKCSFCIKKYSSQLDRNKHEQLHANYRFLCDECGVTFSRKDSMKTHYLALHTNVRPFQCEVCNKSFASIGQKRTHMRVHTGEKPYKCRYCDARFPQMCGLNAHERSKHTKIKPYRCSMCSYTASWSSCLKKHIFIRHSEVFPHKCTLCNKMFKVKPYLEHHIKTAHYFLRPYHCNICGSNFTVKSHLHRHQLHLHGVRRVSARTGFDNVLNTESQPQ